MLILHIMPDLNTGGAELAMKRLIESHSNEPRFEHRVISLRTIGTVGPTLQSQGIRVDALGLHSPLQLATAALRLRRAIRDASPDIVQTWMYHADFLGGLMAWSLGYRAIIWSVRIADINVGVAKPTALIRHLCVRLSKSIPAKITYVAESARRVHEQLGYDCSKSVVITNGFSLPDVPYPGAATLRAELGVGPSTILIGSAGRFNPQKDHRTFVEACTRLASKTADVHFVMAGRAVDPNNPELMSWISQTGRADRFHLLGERNDLGRILAELDIFCLHSLQEGLPNVVGEAMAAAVPCVVTNVGDAAMLVGDTGLVVPPADAQAIASAIEALIRKPAEARQAMGRRARERIASHFSMKMVRVEFERLYEEVARRQCGARTFQEH